MYVETLVLHTDRKRPISLAEVISNLLSDDRPHLVAAVLPQEPCALQPQEHLRPRQRWCYWALVEAA